MTLKDRLAKAKQDIVSANTLPPQIDYRLPWKIKEQEAQKLIDTMPTGIKRKIEDEICVEIEAYYGEKGAAYYDSLF